MGAFVVTVITVVVLAVTTTFVSSHNPLYQTHLQECVIQKIEADYNPEGHEFGIGNLSVYETQDEAPKRLLIAIYDIFGVSNNVKLFADKIAADYDFRVVVPDVFRGVPWDHTIWPPDPEEFAQWRENVANWEIIRYDVRNIMNYYRNRYGITQFGIFGFCFGGYISVMASIELPEIGVSGLVHPSFIDDNMAHYMNSPSYLIPAMDDPDFLPFYQILRSKFGDNSGHRRFNDMCHGFASSVGNYSDPLTFQRVEQTIDILGGFFVRNLRNE